MVSSVDGSAYPHAKFDVQTPQGRRLVALAGRGAWRDENVPLNSQSAVRAVLEFGEPASPDPEAVRADFEHRLSPTLGDSLQVDGLEATALHHLVIDRPRIWPPETWLFPTASRVRGRRVGDGAQRKQRAAGFVRGQARSARPHDE